MKKVIFQFNTAKAYSAFYKKYDAMGIKVCVVTGFRLMLSIDRKDVESIDVVILPKFGGVGLKKLEAQR